MKKKIQVHVADDHEILIEGIIAVINTDKDIEIKGYSLTGKEVIDWFDVEKNKADVLILDITMPVLDGLECTRQIRQSDRIQPFIVAMTANALEEDKEMCFSVGMDDFISKPIDWSKLEQLLIKFHQLKPLKSS